jgi:hypothetical protein
MTKTNLKNELLKAYGTTDPEAIKLKIIWLHIQALIQVHFPTDKPGTSEYQAMRQYKLHWQWSERETAKKKKLSR